MREMEIAGVRIGDGHPPYVIAELGHNHQGNVLKAIEMTRLAAACGANAVKLQKRANRFLFTDVLYSAPYANENSYGATYGAHREALELSAEEYERVKSAAGQMGIVMFATPFDELSAEFLLELGVPAFKIASGDLLNTPLLGKIAKYGKPMIISTGGGTLDDVKRAHDAAAPYSPVAILQCTASYPCEPRDMNLRVIETYLDEFPDTVIGLSDHQDGIALGPAAYALGARLFEKHFTFSHSARGTDHGFSLEPAGLAKYVTDLQRTAEAMGNGVKRPLECERKPLTKLGKALYFGRDMRAGDTIHEADIAIKSPSGPLPPYVLPEVIGRELLRDVTRDEAVSADSLK